MGLASGLHFRSLVFGFAGAVTLFVSPSIALAQPAFAPDLQIQSFSVYSTLPEAGGFRRVSISFAVLNAGNRNAGPSNTRVTIDNSGASFATPALAAGARAFISRSFRTSSDQLAITVNVDAFNGLSGEDKSNNELKQTVSLASAVNRWISIGPSKIQDRTNTFGPIFGVGRVTTIAVDPRSPLTVYAGARGSGIWKRAGSLWFPVGDALPSLQIDAIGIYPRTPDRIVVATPMGVFESLDAGEVWTQINSQNLGGIGSGGGALLIENADNPALYLSTSTGLMVSTDNGRNWKTVLPLDSRVVSLQFSTTDPTHLLASTTDPPRVFEGKNRGLTPASWKQLLGCVSAPLSTFFTPDAKVWITESRGQRWISVRDTVTKKLRLLRSTNRLCPINGFTEHAWEEVPLRGSACASFQNQFSYLFAHPSDPNILFKGGISLCRSEDRGNTTRTAAQIHLDHHAIAVSPSDRNVMFFGTDGGVYRSADKGKTMEFISEGLSNTEFFKIDVDGRRPQFVVGGTQDNFTSTWNGASPIWNMVSGDVAITDSSLVAFNRADMTGIFEIGQSTRQVRLLKPGGGETRLGDSSLPDCISATDSPVKIRKSMASTGANPPLVITCQGIWRGPPWRRIQRSPAGSDADFSSLKLHPSGVLVAVTDAGQVFHGLLNQPPPVLRKIFQTPQPSDLSAIAFDGPGRFYVATNGRVVGRIDRFDCVLACNREDVWQNVFGDITAIAVDPLARDTLIAAVRNRGVFRGTRDASGKWTWVPYNNGLPAAVTVTDLQPQSNGGIIAATFGRGAFQLFSRLPQRPQSRTARGHITSYENERVDPTRPGGPNNPVTETIELDSKPGFVFTSSSLRARFAVVARRAIQTGRIVTIEFTPLGPGSGRIISLR